jgi:hypothetical protein
VLEMKKGTIFLEQAEYNQKIGVICVAQMIFSEFERNAFTT